MAVGIGVAGCQVGAGGGHLVEGVGFAGAVGVELELAGVPALFVDPHPGGYDILDAEVTRQRLDYLNRARRNDHHLAALSMVLVDQK